MAEGGSAAKRRGIADGISTEVGIRPGETELGMTGGREIAMAEGILVAGAAEIDSGVEKTAEGRVGTWMAEADSEIRVEVTAIGEISETAEMERDRAAATTDTAGTIAHAATATAATAEAQTATPTAGTETSTEMVEIATGTEPAAVGTEMLTPEAATDPRIPAETSAATNNRNGAHVGVHRRTLSHPSP